MCFQYVDDKVKPYCYNNKQEKCIVCYQCGFDSCINLGGEKEWI